MDVDRYFCERLMNLGYSECSHDCAYRVTSVFGDNSSCCPLVDRGPRYFPLESLTSRFRTALALLPGV